MQAILIIPGAFWIIEYKLTVHNGLSVYPANPGSLQAGQVAP